MQWKDLIVALKDFIAYGVSSSDLYKYSAVLDDKICRDVIMPMIKIGLDMEKKKQFLDDYYNNKSASSTFLGHESTFSAQESKSKAMMFMINSARSLDSDTMHHFSTVLEEKTARNVFWAMDTYKERKKFLLDIYKLKYECKGNGRLLGVPLCQLSQASSDVPGNPAP